MKPKVLIFLALAVALCSGCVGNGGAGTAHTSRMTAQAPSVFPDSTVVRMVMAHMSTEDKVGQLFVIRPEHRNLPDSLEIADPAYTASLPQPGGYCLFGRNIADPVQLRALNTALARQKYSPLLCVDEEGGRVARLANNPAFGLPRFHDMGIEAHKGGVEAVSAAAATIGSYLADYGFAVDFAPVADVNTNPLNPIIGTRAFGDDPHQASEMVLAYLQGLQQSGIAGCLKHFPGHGDTKTDTHVGYAESLKTWEEMMDCEMVTFKSGIASGVPMIMVAHIAVPQIDPQKLPSTLSYTVVTDKLRNELGYDGIIITDALEMEAVKEKYGSGQASLMAFEAGVDILLMPGDFLQAYNAVLEAVQSQKITPERLDSSVYRILLLKRSLGLI